MVKKALLIIIVLLIVVACGHSSRQIKGDINNDGAVNNTDFMALKGYLLDRREFCDREKWAADLNNDGSITLTDYVQLKKIMR